MIAIVKYMVFGLVLYKSVEGYVGIIPNEEKPQKYADQEGCYISKLDRVLPYNVPYSPKDGNICEQYLCQENNETHYAGCGSKQISEGCVKIAGDLRLPYPDCCYRVRCTRPDGTFIEV